MRSIILDQAATLADVVRIITNGTSSHTPEQLAAQYAVDAARQSGYKVNECNIAGHLEFIAGEGARFKWGEALREALRLAAE